MSLPTFPAIQGTILTQLPFSKSREFRNSKVVMPCGVQYVYRHRTDPLRRWTISCPNITDDEEYILESFFDSVEGRLQPFSFTDPDDGYTLKCRFDQDVFTVRYLEKDSNQVTLLIVEDRTP